MQCAKTQYIKQMTFEEYDQMIERFKNLHTKTLWPTVGQIDDMEKDPERWLFFCCYLYEFGKKPVTNQEKYSKKNISLFINKHLELVDSLSD